MPMRPPEAAMLARSGCERAEFELQAARRHGMLMNCGSRKLSNSGQNGHCERKSVSSRLSQRLMSRVEDFRPSTVHLDHQRRKK